VVIIGLVSLLNDFASGMSRRSFHYYSPPCGRRADGARFIEGLADTTTNLLKLWPAGVRTWRGADASLSCCSVTPSPTGASLIGLSGTWLMVLASVSPDRVGKGLAHRAARRHAPPMSFRKAWRRAPTG